MPTYEWIWEGQTQKGSCVWQEWDGQLRSGMRWYGDIENDIIERTKATYYATVVAEFIKECEKQGIPATLSSVDVQCEIVKDPLQRSCYFVSRGEHYQCTYTQRFIVKVKGIVVFESKQDLAKSPIAPALILAIGKVIAMVLIAIGVGWGIYEFLRNLTLNETRSTVTIKKYDEEGNLIEERTEDVSKKEPSWTSWIGIILLVFIVLFGMTFLFPTLKERYGNRKGKK